MCNRGERERERGIMFVIGVKPPYGAHPTQIFFLKKIIKTIILIAIYLLLDSFNLWCSPLLLDSFTENVFKRCYLML